MSRIVEEFLHRENFNAGDKDDGSIHAIFIWLSRNGGKFLGDKFIGFIGNVNFIYIRRIENLWIP